MFFARKFKQFSDFASFQQSQIFLTKIQHFPPVWRAARRIPSIKIEIWAPIFIIRSLTLIPKGRKHGWKRKSRQRLWTYNGRATTIGSQKERIGSQKWVSFGTVHYGWKSPKISPKNYVLLIFVNGETFAAKVCFMLLISGAKFKYFFFVRKSSSLRFVFVIFFKTHLSKYIFFLFRKLDREIKELEAKRSALEQKLDEIKRRRNAK